VPAVENVQRESSPVVTIALQIMGLDTSFLPVGVALVTNAPNTEDK
jgi:hypothetical protein